MKTLTSDYTYNNETKTFLFNDSIDTIFSSITIENPKTKKKRYFKISSCVDGYFNFNSFDGVNGNLQMKIKGNLDKFQALVGKKLSAYGWNYDNFGTCNGIITKIGALESGKIEVSINDTRSASAKANSAMNSFTFNINQLETLLTKGELSKPNKMLNSGTEASVS